MAIKIYEDFITRTVSDKKLVRKLNKQGANIRNGEHLMQIHMKSQESHFTDPTSPNYRSPLIISQLEDIAEDLNWIKNGKQVVFPTDELLESIWDANFEVSKAGKNFLRSPFESFVIAMPTHISFDGMVLPSPLVTFRAYDAQRDKVFQNCCDHYKIGNYFTHSENSVHKGKNVLTIQFDSIQNPGIQQSVMLPEEMLATVLRTKTKADFVKVLDEELAKCGNTQGYAEMASFHRNNVDADTQFRMLRLVVGLMVYYCAKPESITEGLSEYRSKEKPKFPASPATFTKSVLGGDFNMAGGKKNAMHIRRLVHERYYRVEEFKDWERGTRWIICGADTEPHTQSI